eukprot:TRINITY_DN16761_c0_g1_i1.p1 TRINITY_DN16761_c0_g1~~TRINITY_DN16761_c0_g1_i1.p1  ORF type:complete len:121 (+),score=38.66 TRINITY_DN16761_c0_g1_i1:3-365(+)
MDPNMSQGSGGVDGNKGGDRNAIFSLHTSINPLTKKVECTLCMKAFSQQHSAVDHIESVHFPGSFVYTCEFCDQQFDNKMGYKNHLRRKHKDQKALGLAIVGTHHTPLTDHQGEGDVIME